MTAAVPLSRAQVCDNAVLAFKAGKIEQAAQLARECIDGGTVSGDAYKLSVRVVNPADNKTLLSWDTEAKNKDAAKQVLEYIGTGAAEAMFASPEQMVVQEVSA